MPYSDLMFDRDEKEERDEKSHSTCIPPRCFNNLNLLNLFQQNGHKDLLPSHDSWLPYVYPDYIYVLFEKIDETSPMSPEVFSALRAGNREILQKTKSDDKQLACLVTDQGNSILHVAAASGHPDLVWDILDKHPNLLMKPNSMDELPLHVAASAGHLDVVKIIVKAITFMSNSVIRDIAEETYRAMNRLGDTPLHSDIKDVRDIADEIYPSKNQLGDTPLHAALKRKHLKVACCLVDADQSRSVSFLLNKESLSPLYLAVEAGYTELVQKMIIFFPSSSSLQFQGKSIIHAAMKAKKIDILDAILVEDPTLATSKNEEGRTCLSFGASVGYYEGINYLLDKLPTSHVYVCDDDGLFPIHMATKNGHMKIIKKFLKLCPDSKELLTKQGQNILHIAAKNGKAQLVKYLMKLDKKGRLINEEDFDGNTPLHLAAQYWHPKVVSLLTWNPKVDLKTQNNGGYTALDITEKNMDPGYILRERLTWMALISARAQRGRKLISTNGTMQKRRSFRQVDAGKYKDRVNTLLLVATLVATMTFAAGFTLPGGYNSSAPNVGMAILTEKTAFKVFLICNAMAMYSSVVTIVALIWAQLGDIALILKIFQVAVPLLGISLTSMSVAFMAGVSLVVSHLPWLSNIILGINSVFFLALLLLLIPYVSPQTPSQPFLRHIFYYPYFLLLLAVGDQTNHD